MCFCCLVSHIRREPEADTKDAAEASEAAAAEQKTESSATGGHIEAQVVVGPGLLVHGPGLRVHTGGGGSAAAKTSGLCDFSQRITPKYSFIR